MFFITTNRAATQIKTRIEFVDGVEYWVAPLTMMVPGVHRGSRGPTLYTANELMKAAPAWDMMPITVGHPKDSRGNFISANSDEVLKRLQIGYVAKPQWNGKLVAEAYINIAEARKIAPRIATALAANEVMEVSTGLFHEVDPRSGVCNGKSFSQSAIDHRPDHLAILLDEKGACSCSAGCGLNTNARQPEPLTLPKIDWGNRNQTNPYPGSGTDSSQDQPLTLPKIDWGKPAQPKQPARAEPAPAQAPAPEPPLTLPTWTWSK